MGVVNRTPIVTNGLALYLDAGNYKSYPKSGTAWNDISLNNNNGTLINSPVYSVLDGGNFVINQGANNYVTIPHNALFNFTTGLTISAWIKNANSVDQYISTKVEDSFFLAIGPSGQTAGKASLFLNGTSGGWAQSATTVSTGNWVNITATWNGTNTIFYINGVVDSTNTRTGTILTGTSSVYFGWRNVPTFTGNMANHMFYNRALSASEISQNYMALKSRFGL